jgi:hypothetical protein
MLAAVNWVTFSVILVTTIGLLLQRDWRWDLGMLAFQYFCIFWIVQTHWPVSMAAVKLVTGWMACAILGIAHMTSTSQQETEHVLPQGRLFRVFFTGIIIGSTFVLSLRASSWLGLGLPTAWSSLLLIGAGLLQLGISNQPFRVILGLLIIMAGFEIIYAMVESSSLVAALLSFINLGLALSGAYFLNIQQVEEQ